MIDINGNTQIDNNEALKNLNTYSTDEIRIGTWIDDKPLYGKTIIVSAPTTADTGEDIYTEATEDIKFFKGYLLGQNLTKYGLNLYLSANDTIYTFIGNHGHSVHQKVSNYQTYLKGTNYIWLEYTKTTD